MRCPKCKNENVQVVFNVEERRDVIIYIDYNENTQITDSYEQEREYILENIWTIQCKDCGFELWCGELPDRCLDGINIKGGGIENFKKAIEENWEEIEKKILEVIEKREE